MKKKFPRKEVYVHTTKIPLGEGDVITLEDRTLQISPYFKKYAEQKWESENKEGVSSPMLSVLEIESQDDRLILHCGPTEYKYLLGMVKLAFQQGEIGEDYIAGLSTEIMPLTLDNMFFLEKRYSKITQHGVGFYDMPSAGQHAQIHLDKSKIKYQGLVNGMSDMFGFPIWNMIRNLNVNPSELEKIFYTGFSKGFEVSLDTQINGYARVNLEALELEKRNTTENRFTYNFNDLSDLLTCIGNDGKDGRRIKEDIHGKIPIPNERGFALIDDCLGTLLSNTKHLYGTEKYEDLVKILKNKDYKINEVPGGKIILSTLI